MPHGYTKPHSSAVRLIRLGFARTPVLILTLALAPTIARSLASPGHLTRDPERDNVYGGLDVMGTLELHMISGTHYLALHLTP